MLSNLPNNTIPLRFTFDPSKTGNKFQAIESAMAAIKKEYGWKGASIQGTEAMTNKGKGNSFYFFELEYHPDHADYMYIGVAPKFDDPNDGDFNRDKGCFVNAQNGYKKCFGSYSAFTSELKKGDKMGVLVDMFEGSVKQFINNQDKGWIIQNDKRLTGAPLFVSVVFGGTGTVRIVPPQTTASKIAA